MRIFIAKLFVFILFLDIEEKNMMYAGAGHMPLLLWRAAEQKIYEFREKGNPQKKRWIMI